MLVKISLEHCSLLITFCGGENLFRANGGGRVDIVYIKKKFGLMGGRREVKIYNEENNDEIDRQTDRWRVYDGSKSYSQISPLTMKNFYISKNT